MSGAARAHYILAHILLAGAVLQFFFGGLVIFGAGLLELHFIVGDVMLLLAVIALVLSVVSRRALPWTAALLVAVLVQRFLPGFRESAPALAALHPLNALLILFLALAVFQGAPLALRSGGRGGASASEGARVR